MHGRKSVFYNVLSFNSHLSFSNGETWGFRNLAELRQPSGQSQESPPGLDSRAYALRSDAFKSDPITGWEHIPEYVQAWVWIFKSRLYLLSFRIPNCALPTGSASRQVLVHCLWRVSSAFPPSVRSRGVVCVWAVSPGTFLVYLQEETWNLGGKEAGESSAGRTPPSCPFWDPPIC